MTNEAKKVLADEPRSVAAVYEDPAVAGSYLEKRSKFSWQRLLHRTQVAVLNATLATRRPARVLELAPGPARLAVDLQGIHRGIMVENSGEMISIARARLEQAGLSGAWQVVAGNAFELQKILPQAEFDLAFTFRFIRHFREEQRGLLYQQLRGRLASGGILIFDVVNGRVRERVDAKDGSRASGEIAIYDASYDVDTFTKEMHSNGFEVLELVPVVKHFGTLSLISHKLDDVVPRLAEFMIRCVEKFPSLGPLEWVAVCRKH